MKSRWFISVIVLILLALTGCAPTPEGNVIGYYIARQLGAFSPANVSNQPTGSLTGMVVNPSGEAIEGATVLVAAHTGTPYTAQTDAAGRYHIEGIPIGQYVPAAVAAGYDETIPQGWLQIPSLATITANSKTEFPPIVLQPHIAQPIPSPLPSAVNLTLTGTHTATTPFPEGAMAQVYTYRFDHAGATIDSLRLYLPLHAATPVTDTYVGTQLPMLFMVYPTNADDWESVSVGFAAAGYAFVALSPSPTRELNIDEHAQDARVALALARGGYLHPAVSPDEVILLGGSFSSPILHRVMRDENNAIAAWVTVGGISNALSGSADFYADRLEMPPQYELLIPALGSPNLYPLLFLRYSPVYTAAQLPPTLIIHTDADTVTPIDQAYQLEAALKAAHVPTEVYYYEDVSHYLQIGDDLSMAGQEMYHRVIEFAQRYQSHPPQP